MKNKHRKQYFIDPDVQTGLMTRLFSYWMISLVFITLPLALIQTMMNPDQMFVSHVVDVYATHWPILVMMVFFLPFAMNDAVKFSNRFTGPIYRLRSELQRFEDGERLRPFRFRKNDFWRDIAERFNKVSDRLNKLEDEVAVSKESSAASVAE